MPQIKNELGISPTPSPATGPREKTHLTRYQPAFPVELHVQILETGSNAYCVTPKKKLPNTAARVHFLYTQIHRSLLGPPEPS
ncbi:hypothetical protein N7468_006328 [Penicillium chermesinum]|uniref:Uncharacterized protein n=1 Tax=Penicillium chermesinum TaxID=63820 RepID=A0A9W9NSI4_9EURO|nr:uncharacterized protein N7468_006328 [Penicillium chermesinum]KAJ5225103.1 hypothetical protein N7468_006328 [Penicillium chermesinum]